MADAFYFGNEMQDLLLACMAAHRHEFAVLGTLVKPEYMWGMNAMRVAAAMQDFHTEEGLYPALQVADTYLQEKYSRDKADIYAEVHEYIENLKKLDTAEWKWVKKVTLKFCRERAYIVAIKKAADLLKADKVPEGGFAKMFDEAHATGRDFNDLGICFSDDVEKVVQEATDKTWGVKTGYKPLDAIWRNGWGPGWLVVPLAPPKSYKSTFVINLALQIAKQGTNEDLICPVFYYACEISAQLTALRGYSIVSGMELDKMYDNPQQFITSTRKGLGRWFGETDKARQKHGLILMKSYAAKTATIADIRTHALTAAEAYGVDPRAIIIDHAETIKTSAANKESKASDHRSQADIYSDARALGHELQCVVIMPDRCNKETTQLPVPNMTSFQGSFEKAGVVDVAIGLCQTEPERAKNIIRYFVFMNRHGRQFDYFSGNVGANKFDMSMDEKPLDYVRALEEYEAGEKERRGQRGGGRGMRRNYDMFHAGRLIGEPIEH